MTERPTAESLYRHGLIAVVRADVAGAPVIAAIDAMVRGGIACIEITLTTPGAAEIIAACIDRYDPETAIVGVGSVTDRAGCECAIAAGARFVVTPAICPDAVEAARAAKVPVFCGAFTPTEALTAWRLGADAVKIFPAQVGGPDYLKAIHGPLPHIPLVPTGGVTLDNIGAFFDAGAVAVAVGGNLASAGQIASGALEAIEAQSRAYAHTVAAARPA